MNYPQDFCKTLILDKHIHEFLINNIYKHGYHLFSFREVSNVFPNEKDKKLFSLTENYPEVSGIFKLFSLFHFITTHLNDKSEILNYLKKYGELYANEYSNYDKGAFYYIIKFLKDLDELPEKYYLSLLPKIPPIHESYAETIIQAMPLFKTKHDLEFLKQCLMNIKSHSMDNKLFHEASNAFYAFAAQQTERNVCLKYLLESLNVLLKTNLDVVSKKLFVKIFICFMNEDASKPMVNLSPLLLEWIERLIPTLEQYKSNPTLLYYTLDLIYRLKSNNIQEAKSDIRDLISENSKPLLMSFKANADEPIRYIQLPPPKKRRTM